MIGGGGRISAGRIWAPRIWAKVGTAAPAVLAFYVDALLAGTWTNITSDVHAASGIRIKSGVDENGPLDCVASPGECLFALNNSAKIGRLLGAYSPLNANCRTGWTWGVPIRVTAYDPTSGRLYPLHRGKAWVIDPTAGEHGERLVRVASYDGLYELLQATVQVSLAIGQTESQLIELVLDAVSAESQPVARDMDTGVDTFAYAFHDVASGGEVALGLIKDVTVDSAGFSAMRGDGTFVFRSRHTRADGVSEATFSNTMTGFAAPTSLDQALNRVRVTIRPPVVDAGTDTILYADTRVRALTPGETQQFTVSFTDQSDPTRSLLGGIVYGVNYAANAYADASGWDLTSSLSVALYVYSTGARFTLANTGTETLYLVNGSGPYLQLVGKGYSEGVEEMYESTSVQAYPTRQLDITLRYQDSGLVAQDYGAFIEGQRHSLGNQPQMVEFKTKGATALMTDALALDVGAKITVGETVTGYSGVEAMIQAKDLEIMEGSIVTCRFGLAPAAAYRMWTMDDSAFDDETILGF